MVRILGLILALVVSFAAYAEEGQELTDIRGTNIDMKIYDHAMAGAIKDYVAWGFLDEEAGTSELIIRKYAKTIKTTFSRGEDGVIGGNITHSDESGERTTAVKLIRMDGANKIIYLEINGQEIAVTAVPESMVGHHMLNPTFTTTIDGEEVSYMLGGQSCLFKSLHFAMMILGAYAH